MGMPGVMTVGTLDGIIRRVMTDPWRPVLYTPEGWAEMARKDRERREKETLMTEDDFWQWVMDDPKGVGNEVLKLARMLCMWWEDPDNPPSGVSLVVDEYRELIRD